MKIILKELVQAKPVLERILNQPINIKAAFLLKRLARNANEELMSFEKERLELAKKYGVPTEKGGYVVAEGEGQVKFIEELNKLLDCEIDINFTPISYQLLEEVKLSAVEMDFLDKFIIE